MRRQLTLRDALQSEFLTVDEIARTDAAKASTIVRLHRRVNALTATKTVSGVANDEFMAGVVQGTEVMGTAADIDDVLGEAGEQIATAQSYLSGENATLLGLA